MDGDTDEHATTNHLPVVGAAAPRLETPGAGRAKKPLPGGEVVKYSDFIASKTSKDCPSGHAVTELNSMLFDFQADIVRWAVRQWAI